MTDRVYRAYWYTKDCRLLLLFNLKDNVGQRRSMQGWFDTFAEAQEFLRFLGLDVTVKIED